MLIEKIEILLEQVRNKTQAIRFILKQNQSLRAHGVTKLM